MDQHDAISASRATPFPSTPRRKCTMHRCPAARESPSGSRRPSQERPASRPAMTAPEDAICTPIKEVPRTACASARCNHPAPPHYALDIHQTPGRHIGILIPVDVSDEVINEQALRCVYSPILTFAGASSGGVGPKKSIPHRFPEVFLQPSDVPVVTFWLSNEKPSFATLIVYSVPDLTLAKA